MVKKTINALACALIALSAFAQTSTTTTEQKTTTQPTTTTETASGTVTTTYEPGKIIVVGSESAHDTFSYALDKTVRYVNKAGEEIDEHLIKPGTRIHVYYDGTGKTRVINRVVVDED
jgi:ABC-type Fe3+-hydroxamate transport system substrate-binding protein